jgi:hypothetical protein
MPHRSCSALLLLLLSACATMDPSPGEWEDPSPRYANLLRAAEYPWTDEGECVARESSNEWPILAERCFHALDRKRVRFRDVTGKCAVASAVAAAVPMGVALCIFASPAVVTGAVIVIGTVVVAVAIKEGIDAYERSASRERAKPKTQTQPSREQEPVASREPTPKGLGRDWLPPVSSDEPSERPECKPIPVSHRGGNDPHDACADRIPQNSFPGWDVLVNGKQFDALVLGTRTLWDIKTDDFTKHSRRSQQFFIEVKLPELQREKRLAEECGYDFIVGVRSEAHKTALIRADRSLKVVVMDWC